MSRLSGWPRLLVAGLIAIPLAVLSGAHALSSASLRNAPQLALAAFPSNGLAQEKLAYRTLAASVRTGADKPDDTAAADEIVDNRVALDAKALSAGLIKGAAAASNDAREAIRREPLSPRAFAILALAEPGAGRKTAIVMGASRLSRRDLVLQALVLEQKGEARDYIGAINTIDEILRVHPERQAEFFPVLAKALEDPAAVPGFARLLARPLPWRNAFLSFAVARPAVLENLATIRGSVEPDNKEFDRRLIAGLAESGSLAAAEGLYREVGGASAPATDPAVLDWNSDYPPFDWRLSDQPGFRAQIGDRPDQLEIDVAPGNGGVIAARLLRNPDRPFIIMLVHALEPASQIKDAKLVIACPGQSAPLFERAFARGANAFVVDQTLPCDYLEIAIAARSWTVGRPLTGTVAPLTITTKKR